MQCCTYSKWVHLRCSLPTFSKFRSLGSSHFWSCVPGSSGDNTVTSSSDSSSLYISTFHSGPSPLIQHTRPTLSFKLLIPLPLTSYLLPLLLHHHLMLLAVSLHLLLPLTPLTPSGFFNGMLEISEPGALKCYTFVRFIPLTLSVSRNLTLIYLPRSGYMDSLLCSLIAPAPGLAFSL